MKSLFPMFGLVFILLSCRKTEERSFRTPEEEIMSYQFAEIDSVYPNLNLMIFDSKQFDTIHGFLMEQKWITAYHDRYLLTGDKDTIYKERTLPGQEWRFNFETVYNYTTGLYNYGSYGRVFISEPGNSWENKAFRYGHAYFILDYHPSGLNDNDTFLINEPTLYIDSTFSFSLRMVKITDSLTTVETALLFTFPE